MIVDKFGNDVIMQSCIHKSYPYTANFLLNIVRFYFKRRLFREMGQTYMKSTGLESFLVLNADGDMENGKWKFYDRKKPYIVQNFIDKHDGDYLALLLAVCNPENADISSKVSLVIHPNSNTNYFKVMRKGCLRMYVPGFGYVEDNHYRLNKAIKEHK